MCFIERNECKANVCPNIIYLPIMKSGKLNLFDLTMIVVGLVIGMGIFRTSSDAAEDALTPSLFFIAWIAGGLVALCGDRFAVSSYRRIL